MLRKATCAAVHRRHNCGVRKRFALTRSSSDSTAAIDIIFVNVQSRSIRQTCTWSAAQITWATLSPSAQQGLKECSRASLKTQDRETVWPTQTPCRRSHILDENQAHRV